MASIAPIRTHYWIILKSGELRTRESQPKGRIYVVEQTQEQSWQEYKHWFSSRNQKNEEIHRCEMTTHCGYDRGPKRESIVKGMLLILQH